MKQSAKVVLGKVGIFLFFKLQLYWLWSTLYRVLFENQFRTQKIQTYENLSDLQKRLSKLKWTNDSWLQMFDAVSYPGKVEQILSGDIAQPKHGTDCDEFAVYLTAAIERSLTEPLCRLQENSPGLEKAEVMSVMWVGKDGLYSGHNVCLLTYSTPNGNTYAYMDYFLPSAPQFSVEAVADQVMRMYASDADCIGWAVHNENVWTRKVTLS